MLPTSLGKGLSSHRHASQNEQHFDVVDQLPKSLAHRVEATPRKQGHHHRSQECKNRDAIPVDVAMGILTELDLAVQCNSFSMLQRCRITHRSGPRTVRTVVMNRCCLSSRLPLRVVVPAITSLIQAQTGQFALMYSGASFALSVQTVPRTWRFSCSVARKGM